MAWVYEQLDRHMAAALEQFPPDDLTRLAELMTALGQHMSHMSAAQFDDTGKTRDPARPGPANRLTNGFARIPAETARTASAQYRAVPGSTGQYRAVTNLFRRRGGCRRRASARDDGRDSQPNSGGRAVSIEYRLWPTRPSGCIVCATP
jgi:hypothetical protein